MKGFNQSQNYVHSSDHRLHWNGSGLLLHEFTHLIHQFCLEKGLDDPRVHRLYDEASSSGRYDQVLRRDWAGMEDDHDMGEFIETKAYSLLLRILSLFLDAASSSFYFILIDFSICNGGSQGVLCRNVSHLLEQGLFIFGQGREYYY